MPIAGSVGGSDSIPGDVIKSAFFGATDIPVTQNGPRSPRQAGTRVQADPIDTDAVSRIVRQAASESVPLLVEQQTIGLLVDVNR